MQQIQKHVVHQAPHMTGAAISRPETQYKSVLLDFKNCSNNTHNKKCHSQLPCNPVVHMVQYRPLYKFAQSPRQAFPLNIWLGVGLQGYPPYKLEAVSALSLEQ